MKRIIAGLIIVSTIVSFSACQPTPEKSAVQSKVTGELGKALDAEPTAAVINAEKHVSEEFPATDKKVTINSQQGRMNYEKDNSYYLFNNNVVGLLCLSADA